MSENGFVQWLDDELARRNWRPADLTRVANISSGALSHIYSGNRKVGPDLASAIADALDLPPDLVFRRAGLLPPQPGPERDPSFQEIAEIMRGMSPDERREVVEYALWRFRRKGKGDG